jgi:flagellar basal body-associated protein FliL
MSTQTKIIIAVLIAGVLLVGAYLVFFNTSSSSSDVLTSNSAPASAAEVTFLNLATQLEPITFDTSILTDSRFTSLIDTRTSITPVAQGRRDPFAPVAGIASN